MIRASAVPTVARKAAVSKRSVRAAASAESVDGIAAPMAPFEKVFDPLSFSVGTPPEIVKRYREAELTHGRVAMLATVGILVGEAVEGSSFLFDSQISGPAITHFQQVETVAPQFWEVLVLVIAVAEAYRAQIGWEEPSALGGTNFKLRDNYTPGDIGYDPLGLKPSDPVEFEEMANKELNNGRLAMVSALGMIVQELLTGEPCLPQ